MRYELVHDDLISIPLGHSDPGIYWLRLYRAQEDHVVVVTEVPGNPSFSVTNGISGIISHVRSEFGLGGGKETTYEIWPRGRFEGEDATVHRVRFDGERWDEVTREVIEQQIGRKLTDLPGHDELYARVVAMGGGVMQDIGRPIFEAIPPGDLPAPHNPSNCRYIDRMRAMEEAAGNRLTHRRAAEIGARFIAALTPAEVKRCRYHAANWKKIADEGARIIDELGAADEEEYLAAARASRLGKKDRGWLMSLFADPVFIGGGEYTNGQHRGCALRFSGATRVPVSTGDEHLGRECVDWPYEGGG